MSKEEDRARNQLKEFLRDHALSQVQAAKHLHVSRITISHWIMGHTIPSFEHRKAIQIWTSKKIRVGDWPEEGQKIVPFKKRKPQRAAS